MPIPPTLRRTPGWPTVTHSSATDPTSRQRTRSRVRARRQQGLAARPTLADAHASLGYVRHVLRLELHGRGIRVQTRDRPEPELRHRSPVVRVTADRNGARPAEAERRDLDCERSWIRFRLRSTPTSHSSFTIPAATQEALRSARLALEMNPKFPLGYFWLGRIYTSEGRYKEAETALAEHRPAPNLDARDGGPRLSLRQVRSPAAGACRHCGNSMSCGGRIGTHRHTPSPRSRWGWVIAKEPSRRSTPLIRSTNTGSSG